MKIEIPEDKLRRCRYCGELFLPFAPRQEVCKKPECQRKRKNDKARAYYERKKHG